jgi:hypothetical protein
MPAKLRLVKPTRTVKAVAKEREVRYRFPADDEVWEVSCDGRLPRHRLTRSARNETRRAS